MAEKPTLTTGNGALAQSVEHFRKADAGFGRRVAEGIAAKCNVALDGAMR